ncbi:alkane 1-monooxygenase [Phaeobacter sp. QD34_3]|uniref:alkane 1-monooxygenase n=1 Tax=unclassified Phaeobacter TaxID=2621772 RepID=UPI00237F2CC9|nr:MULTISPECIES: alkane 1-monooxygenase [unclassified Phaeobacter]MDE4133495.1 alkane 1-monooxygenase [Phaeobacter sp. QD34_3]MDE4137131.1 alkane 1-monooxygenase [Phaeobacter sp. QD34_24]
MTRPPEAHADPRRALWMVGFLPPMVAPLLLGLQALGLPVWGLAIIPLALLFGVAPVADHLIGRDTRNVPPEAVAALESDPFYRRLMHLIVPSYALGVVAATALATRADFGPLQWLLFTVGMGFVHSLLVLVAHELGHARAQIDQRMAHLALALLAYGHFGVEHNVGHHKKVATPEDPASARYNESIYRFALREMPGVFLGALEKEGNRLRRRGLPWLSLRNDLLRSWALSLILLAGLVAAFGAKAVPFFLLHSVVAWFSITMANYTAHYGLLREMIGGRREPCQPKHSWSSSYLFSNLLFFNLQRHSDHHANAQRPFQTLSHIEGTPQLPAGIPGLFCMMLVPPVWFHVMNPRLLEAVDHQPSRINFNDPEDSARLKAAH